MARKEGTGSPSRLTIDQVKPPGPRDIKSVLWPNAHREVGVMKLNCAELLDAHIAARDYFRKRMVPADMWSAPELEKEEQVQQVARMLVDPEDADEARRRCDYVEREFWCTQYMLLHGEKAQGLNLEALLNPGGEPDA